MSPNEATLRTFIRIFGTVSGLAVVAVFMPASTMDRIHQALGMGPLPQGPIVDYLARSLSAFYAMLGCLLWVASFDIRRYRPLIGFIATFIIFFAVAIFVIDLRAGMPSSWTFVEGPLVLVLGLIMFALQRRFL